MNEESLKRLLRVGARPEHEPDRQCPDDGEIAAYAERRLSGRDEARVEAHVADCDECLERVAFLVHHPETDARPIAPDVLARARDFVPDHRTGWRAPAWRWAALAATAACVVLAVALQMRMRSTLPGDQASPEVNAPSAPTQPASRPSGPLPVTPGAASAAGSGAEAAVAPAEPAGSGVPANATAEPRATVRKRPVEALPLVLNLPADGATLERSQLEFRWQRVPAAAYYEVHLVTESGDVVWSSRVDGTSVRPPDGTLLEAERTYFVWVRAYLAGGGSLKSAAVGFKVRR